MLCPRQNLISKNVSWVLCMQYKLEMKHCLLYVWLVFSIPTFCVHIGAKNMIVQQPSIWFNIRIFSDRKCRKDKLHLCQVSSLPHHSTCLLMAQMFFFGSRYNKMHWSSLDIHNIQNSVMFCDIHSKTGSYTVQENSYSAFLLVSSKIWIL